MIEMKIDLNLSRNLALGIGPLLPVLETIRRIRIGGNIVWWLDDYLIGLFLIASALLTFKNPEKGRRYLAAAWGFALGMGYVSFFSHLLDRNESGKTLFHNDLVTGVIGFGIILSILGLLGSLRSHEHGDSAK